MNMTNCEMRQVKVKTRFTLRYSHLLPQARLNLRELKLRIIRVHSRNFFPRRRPQNLDYLHKLIDAAVTWEEGLPEEELSTDATLRPNVDRS